MSLCIHDAWSYQHYWLCFLKAFYCWNAHWSSSSIGQKRPFWLLTTSNSNTKIGSCRKTNKINSFWSWTKSGSGNMCCLNFIYLTCIHSNKVSTSNEKQQAWWSQKPLLCWILVVPICDFQHYHVSFNNYQFCNKRIFGWSVILKPAEQS